MWVFTNVGFFSIARKPGDADLTIRARVRDDLDRLRAEYLPTLGRTITGAGTDYPHRAPVSAEALGKALAQIVSDVDYPNFKDAVAERQGGKRAKVYSEVWGALLGLERLDTLARACGGVVIDDEGRVLLRKVAGGFDGYAWTFAKGQPNPGETDEDAALREVQEETGHTCAVLARIPGRFAGGTSANVYFLMRSLGEAGRPDSETEEVRWVSPKEAAKLIGETRNVTGRRRDLAVLRAAVAVWRNQR